MKNKRGITLIALIITIILMLILAGVVISLSLGENGIFARAKSAKIEHIRAELEEELQLRYVNEMTQVDGETVDFDEFMENLPEEYNVQGSSEPYTITKNGYKFKIIFEYGIIRVIYSEQEDNGNTVVPRGSLIYRLDLETDLASQTGVTVNGEGVTVSNDKKYVTIDENSYINVSNDTLVPNSEDRTKTDCTMCCWYRSEMQNYSFLHFGDNSYNGIHNIHNIGYYEGSIAAFQGYATILRCIDPDDRNDGNWHSMIIVWKGGNTVTVYYDGVPFKATGTYTMTDSYLNIGGISDHKNWSGDLADVRVYDEALTTIEAKQVYQWGRQYLDIQP